MNTSVVPASFLFRYAIHIPYVARMPGAGKKLLNLPAKASLPNLTRIDRPTNYAYLSMGWNENGIGISLDVDFKSNPVVIDPTKWTNSDGLSLWIDTRDSRSSQRAGRFCQRFLLLPDDGSGRNLAIARRHPVKRALEEPPPIDETQIRIMCQPIDERRKPAPVVKNRPLRSYRLEAFLPATVLHGFDPESNRRLGIFYRVRDHELGDEILSGAPEMPYWENPSLWATLVLDK